MTMDHYPGPDHIGYPETDPLDSFGRARVAQPFALFDAQFNYGLQPSLFQQQVVNGSITHVPALSAARLSTGGVAVGDGGILQSRSYFRYLPGMSQQAVWTCVFGDPETGVMRTIGLLDGEDGVGFIQDESGIGVLRRTSTSGSPVDNIVQQADWNLDKLDRTGLSKMNLEPDKNNIFVVDYQWLGAGRVRWGFDFSGHITYVHELQWANTEALPFMRTANLPFRAQIENTGVADNTTTFDFNCVAINSGGGSEPVGLMRSTNNNVASAGAYPLRSVSTPVPVLSIRPKVSFNGLIHRGQVKPVSCQIASKDAPVAYSVVLNGTLTGASFTDVDTADSSVEVDVSANAITGGIVIASGYLGAGAGMQAMGTTTHDLENIMLSNNIVGDQTEILSLVISLADGANSNCAGAFSWRELR